MDRNQKIKLLEYTSKGMPLKQAMKFSTYPDFYTFIENKGIRHLLQGEMGTMTIEEADSIISEFQKYDIDITVMNLQVVYGTETLEAALAKLDANNNVPYVEPDPEPEEPEYPSSPYPRKEKRERITVQPEPVARSTDWCIGPDDDDYSGRKIMRIPIRL